jgi:hypothetical protein
MTVIPLACGDSAGGRCTYRFNVAGRR